MSVKKKISDLEKSLKALKAHEKMEAAFKKLSKAEKRVAIAQDVIANLDTRNLVPRSGTYFDIDAMEGADLQTELAKGAKCTVCALGGLFACAVPYKNGDLEVNDYMDNSDIHEYLDGIFSKEQLDLIETAFEMMYMGDLCDPDMYTADAELAKEDHPAVRFGKKYRSDKARMVAIMQNIIDNKGTFKPETALAK